MGHRCCCGGSTFGACHLPFSLNFSDSGTGISGTLDWDGTAWTHSATKSFHDCSGLAGTCPDTSVTLTYTVGCPIDGKFNLVIGWKVNGTVPSPGCPDPAGTVAFGCGAHIAQVGTSHTYTGTGQPDTGTSRARSQYNSFCGCPVSMTWTISY